MANSYKESPLFEQGKLSLQKINTPHLLIGIGAFVLFIQLLPGSIFLPLAFGAAGMYFLRQDNQPLDFRKSRKSSQPISKGHLLIGLAAFLLISLILPGSILLPFGLIGGGIYLLNKQNLALDYRKHSQEMSKAHVLVAIGAFLLAGQLFSLGILLPLALIAMGAYMLRKL
jgi:hypothetical protein